VSMSVTEEPMSNPSSRYVVPGSNGGWDVVKRGGSRARTHSDTQAEAISRDREIVHRLATLKW
jgi:hypothetical protein